MLAQIYEDRRDLERGREQKARISAHSDKTKDMLAEGLIVFCTFYDPQGFERLERSEQEPRDWRYKKNTGLTRLRFVDGQTYIAERGGWVALTPMTREALIDLRHMYEERNLVERRFGRPPYLLDVRVGSITRSQHEPDARLTLRLDTRPRLAEDSTLGPPHLIAFGCPFLQVGEERRSAKRYTGVRCEPM